jgi:hypothetical protein
MSKRNIFAVSVIVLVCSMSAMANTTTFSPGVVLYDLPHTLCYTWGIDFALNPGETITGATLTYNNIYDWRFEPGDHLYTNLLDNPQALVRAFVDTQDNGNDFTPGSDVTLIGTWEDPAGGVSSDFDLVYVFNSDQLAKLNEYASTAPGSGQSNLGFGFDPDCYYYNSGITFKITTSPIVPAPEAILLGGFGVTLVGLMRRRQII